MSAFGGKLAVMGRGGGPLTAWRVAGPLITLMLGAFVLAGGALWYAANEVDRHSVETSKRLARTALDSVSRNLENWVKDYAFWDETIVRLVDSLDPKWAANNVGQYMFDTIGSSITIAVSADDRVLYQASNEAEGVLPDDFAQAVLPKLTPLIERARMAPMEEPVGVSAAVDTPVGILLVAAAAITPCGS